MTKLRQIAESASRVSSGVGKVCLCVMTLLVMANVIMRMTPAGPILGTFELTGYVGAAVTAFALGYNQVKGRNIAVEFLVSRLPPRGQAVTVSLVHLLSFALFGMIAWCCFREGIDLSKTGEVSPTLSIPFYPVLIIIGLGCILLAFVLLTDFLKSVGEVFKK